eukprot:3934780-Rhodomonas_salina.1
MEIMRRENAGLKEDASLLVLIAVLTRAYRDTAFQYQNCTTTPAYSTEQPDRGTNAWILWYQKQTLSAKRKELERVNANVLEDHKRRVEGFVGLRVEGFQLSFLKVEGPGSRVQGPGGLQFRVKSLGSRVLELRV